MDDKNRTNDVEKARIRDVDRHMDGYYSNRDEETAAELTADDYRRSVVVDHDVAEGSSAMGWIALALSIASFFWAPILLGGAGIIVGFIARHRHANTLGNIAIAAGAISILITLFILPFV
jgi:ethanolamine utilization microcompartment shell protein EutS